MISLNRPQHLENVVAMILLDMWGVKKIRLIIIITGSLTLLIDKRPKNTFKHRITKSTFKGVLFRLLKIIHKTLSNRLSHISFIACRLQLFHLDRIREKTKFNKNRCITVLPQHMKVSKPHTIILQTRMSH